MRLHRRLYDSFTVDTMARITKDLWIVRHGQAAHNPRAEAVKADPAGTHAQFLKLMQEDDVLDAPLTPIGIAQAQTVGRQLDWESRVDLVVSSPLSRALATANEILKPTSPAKRICLEDLREINGWLQNAQRRPRKELEELFPSWDLTQIIPMDELWTTELESEDSCAHRAYLGVQHLLARPERRILWIGHGGQLRFFMNQHERVKIVDGRRCSDRPERDVKSRFGNAEIRRYTLEASGDDIIMTELDWVEEN